MERFKGKRTYILCGLALAWTVAAHFWGFCTNETRETVFNALLLGAGVAMRAGLANATAPDFIPSKDRGRKK